MKRTERLTQLKKLSLADLKREVEQTERKLQTEKVAVAFGKSKQVSTIRNLRRDLARSLTISNQQLLNLSVTSASEEK
jgi:ribosomal protein L29